MCFLVSLQLNLFNINSKKSKLMWTDKEGKLQSLQTRRYENAKTYLNDLIKNHIGQSGIPKGSKRMISKKWF